MRQTRDLRVEVGVTEESYRLTLGSNGFRFVDRVRRGGDDAMKGRTQDVVAPEREKICSIYDYGPRLQQRYSRRGESSCRFAEKRRGEKGAYDRRCRSELFRNGVLNLEPADLKGCVSDCGSILSNLTLTESWKSKVKVPVDDRLRSFHAEATDADRLTVVCMSTCTGLAILS